MTKNDKPTITLNVEDAVGTSLDVPTANILDEIFYFPYIFYKQKPYGGKKQIKSVKRVIARGSKGYRNMPTGLLPLAEQYLKSKQYNVEIKGYQEYIKPSKPKLPGIKFRPDQMQAIKSVMLNKPQRGIILAPTGTGKTIIALGAVSTVYPKCNILILAHTVDLLNQFYEDLIKFGFDENHISYLKGKDYQFNKITLSTDKKLAKINPKEYADYFDMVIIDEFHHLSGFSTQYAKILSSLLAPIRIGFTATLPESLESQLAMKSFVGPVQFELTIHKAAELNLLTVPDIKVVTYKPIEKDYDIKSYSDVYKNFIVKNYNRNNTIMNIAEYHIKRKEPLLICVKEIDHLKKLVDLGKRRDLKIYGAQGSTKTSERKEIINNMKSGKYFACIATKVFNEGINIPSLQIVINATGGKSKIENMQKPGRGTRLSKGKTSLLLYDFLDPYRYLAEHSIERMMLYSNAGWKIETLDHTDIKKRLEE